MRQALAPLALLLMLTFGSATVAAATTAEPDEILVSLDLKAADLVDVLRYFAEVSGLNFVLDPSVQGEVTVRLIDVPWDDALQVILRANGLAYELDDNVLHVAPIAVLTERARKEAELRRQAELAAKPITVIATISYADPERVAEILRKTVLSSRGSVTVDRRTSRLIITDVPVRGRKAVRVARRLDR